MKKNIKFIIFALLLVCLILCLLIIKFCIKEPEIKKCNNFELETLVNEINLATNNKFIAPLDNAMSMYVPVVFSMETNYVFSHRDGDISKEYFIIAQNLSETEMFDLESFVETNNGLYSDNQIKMETHGEYTYVIFSIEYDSIIEGIIRSYVYCD